jgi:hypothetical protein
MSDVKDAVASLKPEQVRTAMKSPEHMKQWLDASGRRWLVFNAIELVDALPWPDGHDILGQVVACYRDHRRVIETGRTERLKNPDTGEQAEVPVYKTEFLEKEELDRAIRYLVAQMMQLDPAWSLEQPSL